MSLKVVAVVDKKGTAIDRLAQGVVPYNNNLDYSVIDVHPKRPDPQQLQQFAKAAQAAEIIHFQYFRTAKMLLEKFPALKEKRLILSHYNPYSIYEDKWEEFDVLVAPNRMIQQALQQHTGREVEYVPITVDAHFWQFKRDWQPGNTVIMVANRIEGKKGILEVATACGNLGLKLILVGNISDRAYFNEVLQATKVIEFHENISDEQLRELYHQSTIHVCNSKDNFESGTMPILEAMLCGVPVLTREVGHVPDLFNGDNLVINEDSPEAVETIMRHLENMLNDKKQLEVQRQSAWNTAKNFNHERRAYMYQKLYSPTAVSVIVPIYENAEVIRSCLNAVAQQDYPSLELIVCDDNQVSNKGIVDAFAQTVAFPVRYINSAASGYGLARVRNLGIIEAIGDVLVFCDQRMIMEPDAITKLVNNLVPKVWVYGNKNGKKDFIENFSAVNRQELVNAGMFNERIDRYGGMSQEIRSRTKAQGFRHVFVEDAIAKPMGKSSNKNTKRDDIIDIKNLLFKVGL